AIADRARERTEGGVSAFGSTTPARSRRCKGNARTGRHRCAETRRPHSAVTTEVGRSLPLVLTGGTVGTDDNPAGCRVAPVVGSVTHARDWNPAILHVDDEQGRGRDQGDEDRKYKANHHDIERYTDWQTKQRF